MNRNLKITFWYSTVNTHAKLLEITISANIDHLGDFFKETHKLQCFH